MLPFPCPLSALYGTSGILDVEGASVCLLENGKRGRRKKEKARKKAERVYWLAKP